MKKELTIAYEVLHLEDLSTLEIQLLNDAKTARKKAYAPYSHFHVGCSILLSNHQIIVGNNQENAAYPSGLCAERTAIFWAGANFPEDKIQKIFIVGGHRENLDQKLITPPCGSCRQALLEYETKQKQPIEIYLASLENEIYKIRSIRDLLPFSFDVSFL